LTQPVYWENDVYRRPDSSGHRKGKPRLIYHWHLINQKIDEIFQKYGMGKITERKLYYLLSGVNALPKLKKGYGRLVSHMTDGREKSQWPPTCLVDDRHPIVDINDKTQDPSDRINDLLDEVSILPELYAKDPKYRIHRWHKQKNYVELWTEKQSTVSELEKISKRNNLQVRIVAFGEFPGFADLHKHVNRLLGNMNLNKNIHILYLGDFDPSGNMIDETTQRRLHMIWKIQRRAREHDVTFNFKRIAVTKEQIHKYDLPWDPEKESEAEQEKLFNNPNYKSMKWQHGDVYITGLDAFELLRPEEYEKTIVEAVNNLFDNIKYQELLKIHREKFGEEYVRKVRHEIMEIFLDELKQQDEEHNIKLFMESIF
jgi:hypothetical protein